jgi:hypothetical protein
MMVMHSIYTPKLYKILDSTNFLSNGCFHEKETLIFKKLQTKYNLFIFIKMNWIILDPKIKCDIICLS